MILFSDAFELFSSYYPHPIDEDHFRDCLLHPEYGLYVCIAYLPNLKKCYLIHKSRSIDVCMLIKCIVSTSGDNESIVKLNSINKEQVQSIFLGFGSRFLEICQEISNTSLEACNAVVETLGHKKENLLEEINLIDKTIERKSNIWSDMQIADLQNKKLALQERIESLEKVESCSDKRNRQKFQQMVKRKASALVSDHTSKRWKLGAGAPSKLDSEDERFIAKAVEEKVTYHSRHHDTIMYTNRRVKIRDLKNIANHSLKIRGKKPIKSSITAWNRSQPRNKRSKQAKRHLGKGFFCTKKPPKAEEKDNVNTHHQRSHIKNVQLGLFSDPNVRKYSYVHSMDDKAYVRPGASEGFEKTRNVRILTLTRK